MQMKIPWRISFRKSNAYNLMPMIVFECLHRDDSVVKSEYTKLCKNMLQFVEAHRPELLNKYKGKK